MSAGTSAGDPASTRVSPSFPKQQQRLFHFSEDPHIELFEPRPVRVPAKRPLSFEWLNGPLVWEIDEPHEPLYLFPRDCPRVLIWRKPESSASDISHWLGEATNKDFVAYVELNSLRDLTDARLYRYELPGASFDLIDEAGMWVSRAAVRPSRCRTISDLPSALAARSVELRAITDLSVLRPVWSSSLAASGIRLRNAPSWAAAPEA